VLGIGRQRDVGLHSRRARTVAIEGPEGLGAALAQVEGRERARLYLTSDDLVQAYLRNMRMRCGGVLPVAPPRRHLATASDKKAAYCLAATLGIPSPTPFDAAVSRVSANAPFIAKWRFGLRADHPWKTELVTERSRAEQLAELWQDQIIIQECLPSAEYYQVSVGGYYVKGRSIGVSVVEQVRQRRGGLSTFVREMDHRSAAHATVLAAAEMLATSLEASGFLETEFRVSRETGCAFLLDVNPRAWGWVSILGKKYSGWGAVLSGESQDLQLRTSQQLRWANIPRDCYVQITDASIVRSKAWKNWYRDYKPSGLVIDELDFGDWRPMYATMRRALRR
jgi:hypothetical protein